MKPKTPRGRDLTWITASVGWKRLQTDGKVGNVAFILPNTVVEAQLEIGLCAGGVRAVRPSGGE